MLSKGDPETMSKLVWAFLKQYSGAPAGPKHEDSPKGEKSYGSFQRDLCTGGVTYQPANTHFHRQ